MLKQTVKVIPSLLADRKLARLGRGGRRRDMVQKSVFKTRRMGSVKQSTADVVRKCMNYTQRCSGESSLVTS
jgi:hypothetical protein